MKVNNATVFMGEDALRARHGENNFIGKAERKSVDGRAFATKLDPIAAKKEEAKKKAMQIVGNAFANELKIDEGLDARREKIQSLQKDIGAAKRSIRDIEDTRVGLRESYGVDADSQEEADLKLLEKEIKAKMPGSDVRLSGDDYKRIDEIKKKGLTEYQEYSLALLKDEVPYAKEAYEAEQEIGVENRIISATELERLKSHAMVDAQKQAKEVMKEASKEIISMVVDEGKEHIDQESENRAEKIKAEKEKQEELEEKVDAAKAKRKEQEDMTEEILEGSQERITNASDMNAAQKEIKEMMNKMKLIEDDIKGATVDQSL